MSRVIADASGELTYSGLREGDWRMCETSGRPENDSHRALFAWCWDLSLVS